MTDAPYTFPHDTRATVIEYLMDRQSRGYHGRTYRFCWNVKIYRADFGGDSLRQHNADLDPAFDDRWNDHLENDGYLFTLFSNDAARQINEDEWCSYPGDDQGDWKFNFAGRSGGWIVLEKWRGRDMRNPDADDLAEMDLDDLTAFYRGIRCADSDFTQAKAAAEVEYQAAFYREQLEAEWRAEKDTAIAAEVEQIETARPDLAPAYI